MNFDTQVKLAVYHHFAETGFGPTAAQVADSVDSNVESVINAYGRLRAQRLLALEADGVSIRMAPPFSAVPTQHYAIIDGTLYFANCAWDALGVFAALHLPGEIHSRCEQSGEHFDLHVGFDGPEASDWLFYSLVPASKWWDDITFT